MEGGGGGGLSSPSSAIEVDETSSVFSSFFLTFICFEHFECSSSVRYLRRLAQFRAGLLQSGTCTCVFLLLLQLLLLLLSFANMVAGVVERGGNGDDLTADFLHGDLRFSRIDEEVAGEGENDETPDELEELDVVLFGMVEEEEEFDETL